MFSNIITYEMYLIKLKQYFYVKTYFFGDANVSKRQYQVFLDVIKSILILYIYKYIGFFKIFFVKYTPNIL